MMNRKPASTSVAVANFFILKARAVGGITPMKLEKLIYFAHGWHLAKFNRPLINECVEARFCGIVIPTVFRHTFDFGFERLTKLIYEGRGLKLFRQQPSVTDPMIKNFLDSIWDALWIYDEVYIAEAICREGTPWAQIEYMFKYDNDHQEPIPHETILEYFAEQMPQGEPNYADEIIRQDYDEQEIREA
jgi:uncharacterized phage-associated protein